MNRRGLVLLVALMALPALGRAGGGETYKPAKPSGGGSSSGSTRSPSRSSSGSSSSSGGTNPGGKGDPVPPLIVSGIVLLALILVLTFGSSGRRRTGRAQPHHQPDTGPREDPPPPGLRALMDHDQAFERSVFLGQVRRHFEAVQAAWFKRELQPIRPFVSDATWQRLATQLEIMKSLGVRDATADLRVLDAKLVEVQVGRVFDSIEVSITASLRDSEAPASATDAEAEAIALRARVDTFTEVWTFVRSTRASTKRGTGCPQCGAPFQGNAAGQCEHCGAILNSGHFDWVVTEMTQSVEAQSAGRVTGLSEFEKRDEHFSVAVLEDRASLVFWKWVDAQRSGSPASLAKVSSPAFFAPVQAQLAKLKHQGLLRRMDDCAVGAVNTKDLRREGEDDVAACEVRWSAKGRHERYVLLLKRRGAGAPSTIGLATNRCAACSAPLTDNGQPTCEYCGAALAASAQDWVLDTILTWEQFIARGLQRSVAAVAPAPPPKHESLRLFQCVAAFARTDGVVTDQERLHLRQLAKSWGLAEAVVEPAIQSADATPPFPRGSPEAVVLLSALIELALVDQADIRELQQLTRVAASLGLAPKLTQLLAARKRK